MNPSSLKLKAGGADLYVGPAGWSYEDWKGIVYPASPPRGYRHLEFLSRYFNCVEVNSSFYNPPNPRYAARWVEDVAGRPDFQFTAKLWQRFTHEREEWWTPREAAQFREGLAPLAAAGRLGAVVVQFPYSFHYGETAGEWLGEVVGEFRDWPLVVEVRSRDWLKDEALRCIERLGAGFCNIDQPQISGNIPLTTFAFGPVGYLRMHGRNEAAWFAGAAGESEGETSRSTAARDRRYDYLYSPGELDELEDAIRKIAERVERMYVVANNHYRGQAPANALQLMGRLTGEAPAVPELLAGHYELP